MPLSLRNMLAKRADLTRELRELADQSDENGKLTDELQTKFNALRQTLEELEQAIQNRALIDEYDRRAAGTRIPGSGDARLDGEIRNFSLVRLIAAQAGIPGVDAGREMEISTEIAHRSGRQFQGVAVPMAVLGAVERRAITSGGTAGTAGGGGSLIQTSLDANQFIDALRANLVIRSLGARVLENLTGNLDLPRLSTVSSAGWVAENTALPESDQGFDKVSLRPKHAGAFTELSRNMLMQSSPDIEQLVRDDFSQVLARALDLAAIAGTGSANNQPTGILQTSGIGSVAIDTNGGPLTWAAVLGLIEAVETANASDDARAFLGNPKIKAHAMQTPKISGVAGIGMMMEEPDKLAGYRYASSTQVPSNGTKGTGTGLSTLLYGNWSDLVLGLWSELDILVNPYAETAYQKGNVQVRAMLTCDIALRHPESFAAITDIVAS